MVRVYKGTIITICNDGLGFYPVLLASGTGNLVTLKIACKEPDEAMEEAS